MPVEQLTTRFASDRDMYSGIAHDATACAYPAGCVAPGRGRRGETVSRFGRNRFAATSDLPARRWGYCVSEFLTGATGPGMWKIPAGEGHRPTRKTSVPETQCLHDASSSAVRKMHSSVFSVQLRDTLEFVQFGGALLTGGKVFCCKRCLIRCHGAVEKLGQHGIEVVTRHAHRRYSFSWTRSASLALTRRILTDGSDAEVSGPKSEVLAVGQLSPRRGPSTGRTRTRRHIRERHS